MNSSLSFGKVLTGISKTLTVANQVIPLYQQSKPLFKNAKLVYDLVRNRSNTKENKEILGEDYINDSEIVENKTPTRKEPLSSVESGPQFFI